MDLVIILTILVISIGILGIFFWVYHLRWLSRRREKFRSQITGIIDDIKEGKIPLVVTKEEIDATVENFKSVLVFLRIDPNIPEGASPECAERIISESLDEAYENLSAWIDEEEPYSEVINISPGKDSCVSGLVEVRTTPRMIELLLSEKVPQEACVSSAMARDGIELSWLDQR